MDCAHFDAGRCRSCTLLPIPHTRQVQEKQQRLRDLLDPLGSPDWSAPFTGRESGFRNKAKMVVGGTVTDPTLGILDADGLGVDLRDCGLHSATLQAALPVLAAFITTASLTPYDVGARRGELKHLIVTEAPSGALMARFVLRSTESLLRIRKHLPSLLAALPGLEVVSVNLQPEHKAVLEGPEEIVLHGETLTMQVNDVALHLRPQSFFQTNTEVAAMLYEQAGRWVDEALARNGHGGPASVIWDLYCGVGGFALHLAAPGRTVRGVEISAEAIESARTTAAEQGRPGLDFVASDATEWALAQSTAPDLVVLNPPRRGIGAELARWIEESTAPYVLYSSCNAESLARDLAAMGSMRMVRARMLDMFPQSSHYEVLVLMARHDTSADISTTDR
ncbi:23S rRNA (uracil(747)-C(5))-methyltransferase RlmC [Nocardioides gilvus]|uniref:23S rRNA (uracil(747)-C(5))-methyltransferase RlmC n=1 Tax=Nocardioides gilvus TaxID=1735589 RepID=UPI000D7403F1|nr:23S rRNA (uracil(747)-C(5))-methyltransferase RlmC [Nocardioides gilvus]